MSKRFNTYGGVLKWNHTTKQITQTRCLNPPSYNARFLTKIRKEYPNYKIIEEWRLTDSAIR